MNEMTPRHIGCLLSIIATFLLAGCGPKHMVVADPALNDGNSGHLTIYRPDTFFIMSGVTTTGSSVYYPLGESSFGIVPRHVAESEIQ